MSDAVGRHCTKTCPSASLLCISDISPEDSVPVPKSMRLHLSAASPMKSTGPCARRSENDSLSIIKGLTSLSRFPSGE